MHLTEAEFIEHLDGALRAERAAHLASCERCRRDAEALASTLTDARSVEVPEPSPLFWDHFSVQVREAIDQPESSRRSSPLLGVFHNPGWTLAAVALASVVMIAAVVGLWPRAAHSPADSVAVAPDALTEPTLDLDSLEADLEWTFVTTMADGIDWETADAAGLSIKPGAAERAALQLSREEQAELARLLREEMGGDGSL